MAVFTEWSRYRPLSPHRPVTGRRGTRHLATCLFRYRCLCTISGNMNPRITYVYTLQDLSYRDRHWHDKCFKCGSCSTSLVNESFAFKNDQLYCAACYEQMFAQRCTKCKLVFRPGNTRLAVAHPPAESRHGGLNVLLNVLLLFLYFIFIYFYRKQETG